jgi:hypothetical protein
MGLIGVVEVSFCGFLSADSLTLGCQKGGGGGAREQWLLQSSRSCAVTGQLFSFRTSVATEKKRWLRQQQQLTISAKITKGKKSSETEYPWPEKIPAGAEMDGALAFLNRFKPLPNKPKPFPLPFEHPLIDLENKIDEVCSFFTLILSTFQASLHYGLSTKPSILVYFLRFLHAVLRKFPGLFLCNFCKAME